MFGTVLISICTIMHIYLFWRIAAVPFLRQKLSRKTLIIIGIVLWLIFTSGRIIGHGGTGVFAQYLEFIGMTWMAVLFLTFTPLLLVDIFTLFGFLLPRFSSTLRSCAMVIGIFLSVIAIYQGLRPPIIEKYEVNLAGLPDDLDGMTLVAISDMHLGSQLGEQWLAARIAQVTALRPDIVVLLGDIFEGHGAPADQLLKTFKQLSAPFGVWAVPGNHEFYGGNKTSMFKEANVKLLNNSSFEVRPGLILAGVEDLTTWYRKGQKGDPISQTLTDRPAGATILLSHTPWQSNKIAATGVGLMLSGHTHGGQIWPFDYLVQNRYPLLQGLYRVNDMTVIVCRGTGTWGPRMRLWQPGEILMLTLRKNFGDENLSQNYQ